MLRQHTVFHFPTVFLKKIGGYARRPRFKDSPFLDFLVLYKNLFLNFSFILKNWNGSIPNPNYSNFLPIFRSKIILFHRPAGRIQPPQFVHREEYSEGDDMCICRCRGSSDDGEKIGEFIRGVTS